MASPLGDQDAARRRETARQCSARLARAGVPAIIRSRTVWVTCEEEAALAAGVLPPSLQLQLDRQDADDAVIEVMEDAEWRAQRSRRSLAPLSAALEFLPRAVTAGTVGRLTSALGEAGSHDKLVRHASLLAATPLAVVVGGRGGRSTYEVESVGHLRLAASALALSASGCLPATSQAR